MDFKKFLLAGLAGTIVYFLLGWLFYGILFTDIYPSNPDEQHLHMVFLGCLVHAFFISYIFNQWAGITNWMSGAQAAALIGFMTALSMNFFMYSNKAFDFTPFALDVAITTVMSAITGAVIAMVSEKA